MRRLRRFAVDARAQARLGRFARIGSRAVFFTAVVCVLGLVTVQFALIVAKNVAIAGELAAAHSAIEGLQIREADQRRTIVRLSDPHGAIPEIHDKLRVVGKREEIIYVRGYGRATPAPGDWHAQP